MGRVEGKTALVTGAAHGIGKAAAILLAKEGAKVAVTDVDDEAAEKVAFEIEKNGGTAAVWHLNVSDESEVERVMKEAAGKLGDIHILVNNAGISGPDRPTHKLTEEDWDKVFAVNVKGVAFCTKHVIPFMKKCDCGSIINLSSIYGIVSAPDVPPYHASKGAVRIMAKSDALQYAKHNIRVNSVHPGFIWTPMVKQFTENQEAPAEEVRKNLNRQHPLGHIGEPDDVAYGILYLASDESKFVTGTELVIDGGYTSK